MQREWIFESALCQFDNLFRNQLSPGVGAVAQPKRLARKDESPSHNLNGLGIERLARGYRLPLATGSRPVAGRPGFLGVTLRTAIFLRDGNVDRIAARYGFSPELEEYVKQHPIPLSRETLTGRVAVTGGVVHIPDALADPEYTYLEGVPLLRAGACVGVMAMNRTTPTPFTTKQIELATTFADQAMIAIENVRLFEAEQRRTRELSESLDQQSATLFGKVANLAKSPSLLPLDNFVLDNMPERRGELEPLGGRVLRTSVFPALYRIVMALRQSGRGVCLKRRGMPLSLAPLALNLAPSTFVPPKVRQRRQHRCLLDDNRKSMS